MINWESFLKEIEILKNSFFKNKANLIENVIKRMENTIKNGGKIIIFGNGGSASQAQHFAAELVNKFLLVRRPLPALSLTTDTSILTSIGNDVSFNEIFSKQIEALGKKGDIALGISTSGNSLNVIQGIQKAREKKIFTIGLTGEGGGKLAEYVDLLIDVPSKSTPRIQEIHLMVLHIIAEELEKNLYSL
jgi:D-sedoheptulose 7-phosphate isomerase